jgi:UDP-N-acetylglucosamine 2-epimerase (non-hydrolysing)
VVTRQDPWRIGVVLGTRPEAVKLAPVVAALAASPEHQPVVISTGQHRELLGQVLDPFGVRPDVDLDLMAPGQSLTDLAGRALQRMGEVLDRLRVELLVVQGDTTTTLAGALAGFYRRIPVAHVEAGLRTDDRFSPYPEEVNRRLVTQLADLHLAPTEHARDRLLGEGVDPAAVVVTGNTVVDALFATVRRRRPFTGPDAAALERVESAPGRVVLVTAHRRESWGAGLAAVAEGVAGLVGALPDVHVVFPMHPNPVVRQSVLPWLEGRDRVLLTEPLDYPDLVRVLDRSALVVTDSGGLQEEACSLGRPTLVTRETTERSEGAEAGGLLLIGTDAARIRTEAVRLLSDPDAYDALTCTSLPFGDGHAAERVVAALSRLDPSHTDRPDVSPSLVAG